MKASYLARLALASLLIMVATALLVAPIHIVVFSAVVFFGVISGAFTLVAASGLLDN